MADLPVLHPVGRLDVRRIASRPKDNADTCLLVQIDSLYLCAVVIEFALQHHIHGRTGRARTDQCARRVVQYGDDFDVVVAELVQRVAEQLNHIGADDRRQIERLGPGEQRRRADAVLRHRE